MFKSSILWVSLLAAMPAYSQEMPAETRRAFHSMHTLLEQNVKPGSVSWAPWPVYSIQGTWYLSLIGRTHPTADWTALLEAGVLKGAQVGAVATLKMPVERLADVNLASVFAYVEVPRKISPHLDRARYDTRVDSVFAGAGLPQRFDGSGVLIGVTDWGFDYTHPMLYDTLMQQTRITAAWDQYKNIGNAPPAYGYGAEYDTPQELLNAQGDTANIYSFHTHGQHVAGIAAGGGAGIGYRGMAPASGLLLATFLIDEGAVLDAFQWMKDKADALDMRLVVNMSWGLHYMGTLDGSSLLSQAISGLSDQGVVFVSSAGNNGDVNFHIRKEYASDTLHTRIQFGSASVTNMWGQSITMWGQPGGDFKASLRILSGNNTELAATPYYHSSTQAPWMDSMLVVNNDTIQFNLITDAAHPQNGSPHMRLRVKSFSGSYKVVLSSTAASGVVHYWNVAELTTGVGNWGQAFMNPGLPGGQAGNAQYSIAEPACAGDLIAVAAHAPEYLTNGGNLSGGNQASFTSIGPLINEVMKPDISAPGVSIASSVSSMTDASYFEIASVEFDGGNYPFARFSGTSMSSPCVAGIAALVLQANPQLSPQQVKSILMNTTRLDNFTGAIDESGHVRWGRGKVNAYAAVQLALATVGVREWNSLPELLFFPNPATDRVRIASLAADEITGVSLVGMDGRIIHPERDGHHIHLNGITPGAYVLCVQTEASLSTGRLVVR